MKQESNLLYGHDGDGRKRLDIYLPDGKPTAAFLYFHGGGLTSGDKGDAGALFAAPLTEAGVIYVSANYRLYPDAAYPDFLYDAAEAVAYVHTHLQAQGEKLPLYVGGSSAGGYLSMMLCFDPRYLRRVGLDNTAIDGYFHDAGQPTAHYTVLTYRGEDARRVIVDESAPLYYIGREERYPPMRFLVSDDDIPGRYEQTLLLLATLKSFGYDKIDAKILHGGHCHYVGATDDKGRRIFPLMILEFIASQGR